MSAATLAGSPGVGKAYLDAKTLKGVFEEGVGTAVQFVAGHNIVPGGGDGHDRVANGGHTRGGGHRTGAAIHCGEAFFKTSQVGFIKRV